jgi:hypothetical protein
MAWVSVPNNSYWEYDNNPPDPGADSPYRDLWLRQTNGIRTDSATGHKVYTRVRRVNDGDISRGELSKSYWDTRDPI